MRKRFLLLVAMFGAVIMAMSFNLGPGASATATGTNGFLIPSASSSTTAGNNSSDVLALSANGKYAIASTAASDSILGSGAAGVGEVFDIQNGTASPFVLSTAGTVGSPRRAASPVAVSETGRYVAFVSNDTNLIDGTTTSGTNAQLYLRDMQAGTTTLLSHDSSGNLANAPIDYVYGVSSDGRFVLFETTATNLSTNATNGYDNFYMFDRSTGSFTIVNLDTSGNDPYDPAVNPLYAAGSAAMSCDGSLVAFAYRSNLTGMTGYNDQSRVYLLDRRAGNKLSDLTPNSSATTVTGTPTISCNGDYVGFVTNEHLAYSDIPSPSGFHYHAYVYNRVDGSYHMVDQSTSGTAANTNIADNIESSNPSVSDCTSSMFVQGVSCVHVSDNGIATFSSSASNLVSGAATGVQAYVRNINTSETDLVTQTANSNIFTASPAGISLDGKEAVYNSAANDLVSGGTDTNNADDTFLYQTGF